MATQTQELTETTSETDDSDKKAQQARSKRYGIAIKDGGNVTKPSKWSHIPDSAWGDPVNYAYPLPDKSHADNAAARWGDDSNRSQYSGPEQKIVGDRIDARQRHFGKKSDDEEDEPDHDGNDDDDDDDGDGKDDKDGIKESQPLVVPAPTVNNVSTLQIKPSIATLTVCFIEDNARSLNRRLYPRQIVDTLISRAQERLADPDGLPITCFTNHPNADGDQTLQLVGKATQVWREGTRGYANLAFADTTAGRDSVALVYGGYLRTESLRASGVIQRLEPGYDLPIVVEAPGERAELDGIDLTSFPGLASVARIKQLMLEAHTPNGEIDCFNLNANLQIQSHEVSPMTKSTVTETNKQSETTSAMASHRAAHEAVHDHMAHVLDEVLSPIHGNPKENRKLTPMEEHLAKKHLSHLIEAHDVAARQTGKDCAGGYESAMTGSKATQMGKVPEDGDGDNDLLTQFSDESKRKNAMNIEEARKLLAEQGYKVEAPKTAEEKLKEEFETKLAEQKAAFEEMLKQYVKPATPTQEPPPQRQSLVEGANNQPQAKDLPNIYRHGSYLRNELHPSKWAELADRSRPLPPGLNPSFALKEMEKFLVGEAVARANGFTLGLFGFTMMQ